MSATTIKLPIRVATPNPRTGLCRLRDGDGRSFATGLDAADAEFVTVRVNSYAALVEALKACFAEMNAMHSEYYPCGSDCKCPYWEAHDKAMTAFALAGTEVTP